MWHTFCGVALTLLLLTSSQITGPWQVSGEELTCQDMTSMMEKGVRVVRGRDWNWGAQDGTPPTARTVLGPSSGSAGWFRVRWDSNNTDSYRMGHDGKCDLTILEPKNTSTPTTPQSSKDSYSTTTPQAESSTSSQMTTLPSSQQCTCTKEISERQAMADAETAELAKEVRRLEVEAGKLSVEAAKVALEAAQANAKADEAQRLLEVEAKKVYLEAAKSFAMAEDSWASYAAEELQFERQQRNKSLLHFVNNTK